MSEFESGSGEQNSNIPIPPSEKPIDDEMNNPKKPVDIIKNKEKEPVEILFDREKERVNYIPNKEKEPVHEVLPPDDTELRKG